MDSMQDHRHSASIIVSESLAALSLGASFAHVIELRNKLALSAEDYHTVQQIYRGFGPVAGVLEPATMVAVAHVGLLARGQRAAPYLGAAAGLLALSVATWATVVKPMNREMAGWSRGIPSTWRKTRARWEWGHVAVFCLKLGAFGLLVAGASALRGRR
jgi:hypothetical protein